MCFFWWIWIQILFCLTNISVSTYITYSTITGYFLQDNDTTNATTFDYTATNFGLINQTYASSSYTSKFQHVNLTQWQKFSREVSHLNHYSPLGITYKVLFLGRHGEGFHNTAEAFYGTPAWNCYYSLLNGNATTIWEDAHVTDNGVEQALIANAFWRHLLSFEEIPAPQSYYSSPLYRCLQTANYTFSTLPLPKTRPFIPMVKEGLREGISEHTCDRRSDRTFIQASFPSYRIESGFSEHDELWTGIYSETTSGQDERSKIALDDIFTHDTATWISITSHSGEIASLLRLFGHRAFPLNIGAVIPVLVKAEIVDMMPTGTASSPSRTPSAHCAAPPVSSVSGLGCVCQDGVASNTGLLVGQVTRSM